MTTDGNDLARDRALSLAGFLLAVLGLLGLLYTRQIFATGPISIVLQGLALALMVWARVTFGMRSFHAGANPTEGGLVASGPYRWWRHPIYAAVLLFAWVGVSVHLSPLSAALGGLVTLGLGVRMSLEEKLLQRRYPEYAAYAAHTRRVLPFFF